VARWYFRSSLPLPAEQHFHNKREDTDDAVCSGETACHEAQTHGQGPALEGLAPCWGDWLRGVHVPVGAWEVQLNVSHEIRVFRAGCQSPAPGSGRMSSLLVAFSEFHFGCPYRCLGQNESAEATFFRVSVTPLSSVCSCNSVSRNLNGMACGILHFHGDAVSGAQWITKL